MGHYGNEGGGWGFLGSGGGGGGFDQNGDLITNNGTNGSNGDGGTGDKNANDGNNSDNLVTSSDPLNFLKKLQEIISQGYEIAVAEYFTSNNGNSYGSVGYYDPNDKLGESKTLNMLASPNSTSSDDG